MSIIVKEAKFHWQFSFTSSLQENCFSAKDGAAKLLRGTSKIISEGCAYTNLLFDSRSSLHLHITLYIY